MARSIWTGVISFGLVSVPVRLHSATHEHDVSFHQFEKGTGDRIRYQRVNERTGKEVDYDQIVKGADVGGGSYVMLEPNELESVAPGRSRSIDVHSFVDLDEIDPIYYQKSYYLAPASEETAKTYALLREAMTRANRAAIGTLVMRGKEYLAAVRPADTLLVLETMFFADEIRDAAEQVGSVGAKAKARPEELKMAAQLIDSMTGSWNPKDYHDTYTDRVNEMIAAKKSGATVTVADKAPEPTNGGDLMGALQASVDAARSGRSATGTAKKAGAKRTTAKKTAAKKTTAKKTAPARKSTSAKTRAPAKKSTSRRTTPARKSTSASTSTSTKRTAAKKAPGRKAA